MARRIALLLAATRVRPNHITAASMVVGLAAAAGYASGSPRGMGWGAVLYVLSAILDHADGELARLTGTCSAAGQTFDRVADLLVRFALFTGMGIGLSQSPLGPMAVGFGLAAGVAFVVIFASRGATARLRGWDAMSQPTAAGLELDDILYVIAPVTWVGWLAPFVVAAGIGAPLFALWCARGYLVARAAQRTSTPRRATSQASASSRPGSGDRLVVGRRS
jgi:phosphatidylglycerophosphate synthase